MKFCDAHVHLAQCGHVPDIEGWAACTCSHEPEEFLAQKKLVNGSASKNVVQAFGLHPQRPVLENAGFMENLLAEGRIGAVGETGFDFFTPELKSISLRQEEAWRISLELCRRYNVPMVVHCRKAFDRIMAFRSELKHVPAVVMHSFAFTEREASSLVAFGVNAYFSFGKQLLNGNKRSIGCVRNLPLELLLLETDAPYQTLKGEVRTSPDEIKRVYSAFSAIREIPLEDVCSAIERNFKKVFLDLRSFSKAQ